MKKLLGFAIISILLAYSAANAQFSFGVGSTLGSTGTYFGYQFGNFVPYIGFQYLGASLSYERDGFEFQGSELLPYKEKAEASANVYMPAIGLKYFVKEDKSLKAYVNANIFKPFISLSSEQDGLDNAEVSNINDNISAFGLTAGFGVEYFFSPQFSLGGEFGLNAIFISSEYDEEDRIYNPTNGNYITTTTTYNPKLNMGITYGKITLNFYFDR